MYPWLAGKPASRGSVGDTEHFSMTSLVFTTILHLPHRGKRERSRSSSCIYLTGGWRKKIGRCVITDQTQVAEEPTKKAPTLQQYYDFPVEVGFPSEEGEEDDRFTYRTVAVAETFSIAREAAYSLAQQGLRLRYPKPENKRSLRKGWYVVSPDTARTMSQKTWEKYATESIADRAVILAGEMRIRSKIGGVINELRHIADESKTEATRGAIRRGILQISRATFSPLSGEDIQNIGLTMLPDYQDTLAEAYAANGVEEDETCPSCGEIHPDEHLYTPEQLLALAEAEFNADMDPVGDAMYNVEGVQA